jgi:hypothetical protein
MPSVTTKCPFCPAKPQSYTFLRHVLSHHKEELLAYGKNKDKLLSLSKQPSKPFSFYFPNGQDNWCCLGCQRSCVKKASIDKHFPEHAEEHMAFLKKLLTDQPQEIKEEKEDDSFSSMDKFQIARLMKSLQSQIRSLEYDAKNAQNKLDVLLSNQKITQDDIDDVEDLENKEDYDITENPLIQSAGLGWLEQKHVQNPKLLNS